MTTTLGAPSLLRQHGGCDPVAVLVARELGVQPATVHGWIHGPSRVNRRVAHIIAGFKLRHEEQRLVRWLAPIEAALRGILAPPDSPALAIQAATADHDEDIVEVAYLLGPSRETAAALVRAIDTERALQLERRQALVAEWDLPC